MSIAYPPCQSWTRVCLHLPNAEREQRKAFIRIVNYVKRLKDSDSQLTGFTQIDQVSGQWWDSTALPSGDWVADTITLLVLDVEGDCSADETLRRRIARIRRFAFACYKHFDEPTHRGQDEIWMMMHPVNRFA